jgi:undecaprenyl-diphosphatase
MPLYQVLVFAVVQGITEFLPISSSAHLALAPWLLGWPEHGLVFDIALHLGTLVAVLLYFWRDLLQIVAQGLGLRYGRDQELARNPRLVWLIGAATVPAGVAGLLFESYAENAWHSNYVLMGSLLVGVGVLMLVAEKFGKRSKDIGRLSFADAMVIGASQALAIVPGTSRSGITLTAGLFRNLDRAASARFSFLLSTPVIAAAADKAFWDLHRQGGIPPDMRMAFLVGVIVSGVVGCAVIALLLRYLRTHTLKFFVYYRVIFGIMVIALATIFRQNAG